MLHQGQFAAPLFYPLELSPPAMKGNLGWCPRLEIKKPA